MTMPSPVDAGREFPKLAGSGSIPVEGAKPYVPDAQSGFLHQTGQVRLLGGALCGCHWIT